MKPFGINLMLLLFLDWKLVQGEGLVLCNESVSSLQLCKKFENYIPNIVPKPWPRFVDIIIDLKNIIELDHDRNIITVYIYMITQWISPTIAFAIPTGKE